MPEEIWSALYSIHTPVSIVIIIIIIIIIIIFSFHACLKTELSNDSMISEHVNEYFFPPRSCNELRRVLQIPAANFLISPFNRRNTKTKWSWSFFFFYIFSEFLSETWRQFEVLLLFLLEIQSWRFPHKTATTVNAIIMSLSWLTSPCESSLFLEIANLTWLKWDMNLSPVNRCNICNPESRDSSLMSSGFPVLTQLSVLLKIN
jgi:hypothetical protein